MTDQLMRCPFCEESARIKQLPFCPEDIKSKKWVVGCDGKNGDLCPGYIWKCAPFYVTRDQAVEYWNHRAPIAKADDGWISVKDRLPEDEGDVLVYGVSPRGRKEEKHDP